MKHDLYLDEFGKVDLFRLEYDIHNGPQCRRCGHMWCHHCEPNREDEECPSGQLEFPL